MRVVASCLWGQLLQELNVELHAPEERRVLLGSQQLGIHILVGFQPLLILIAIFKHKQAGQEGRGGGKKRISPRRPSFLAHLGFHFIVVISLISCSSRKEKLGSNTSINFITSGRFSPEAGPPAASGDARADPAASGSINYGPRNEKLGV